MDSIVIRDLRVRCIVGINDDERREKQDIVITVTLYTDLAKAGKTDRFEDAVDYREMKKRIVNVVENSQFFLIEALAETVARTCLEHRAVKEVRVTVDKPFALRFARSVAVEITRRIKE